jgi:hypothetical protein
MRGIPDNPVTCAKCGSDQGCPGDDLCGGCRLGRYVKKYPWTAGQEKLLREAYQMCTRRPELSAALDRLARQFGYPKRALKDRARTLAIGVFVNRRLWTRKEDDFLREHCGTRSAESMRKTLKRSYCSVAGRIQVLKLQQRVTAGYSNDDLCYCFGVSDATVRRWFAARWLVPKPGSGRVPEHQIRPFIFAHPREFDLRRVDQAWFKGIAFPKFNSEEGRQIQLEARRDRERKPENFQGATA